MTTPLHSGEQESTGLFFVLTLNGKPVSARFTNRVAAEMARSSLSPDQQKLAEVQAVDASGRQLLLG